MPSTDDSTDPGEPRYIGTFDASTDEQPSEAVVNAVAAVAETSPVELPPLYEAVDPDALDALVAHACRQSDAGTHELWFTYYGLDVGVRTDGQIRIRETTAATNPDLE